MSRRVRCVDCRTVSPVSALVDACFCPSCGGAVFTFTTSGGEDTAAESSSAGGHPACSGASAAASTTTVEPVAWLYERYEEGHGYVLDACPNHPDEGTAEWRPPFAHLDDAVALVRADHLRQTVEDEIHALDDEVKECDGCAQVKQYTGEGDAKCHAHSKAYRVVERLRNHLTDED